MSHEQEPGEGDSEVNRLLGLMRRGDRTAAAEFVTRYGSRIRRRIRGKLSPGLRRLFDSQDALATLGRRLDLVVRRGGLLATTEAQLWSYVMRVAETAIIDKARVFRRLQNVERCDGPVAQAMMARLRQAQDMRRDGADIELDAVMNSLPDETDRQILSGWLHGLAHNEIGELVGMASTAVRKRWQRIRSDLRDRFAGAMRS